MGGWSMATSLLPSTRAHPGQLVAKSQVLQHRLHLHRPQSLHLRRPQSLHHLRLHHPVDVKHARFATIQTITNAKTKEPIALRQSQLAKPNNTFGAGQPLSKNMCEECASSGISFLCKCCCFWRAACCASSTCANIIIPVGANSALLEMPFTALEMPFTAVYIRFSA